MRRAQPSCASWPIGHTIGTWSFVAAIVETRRTRALCKCIVCGVERIMRPDAHAMKPWHAGCTAPKPAHPGGRKMTRDDDTCSGDHPCWAEWSAMLHMGDPKCATWTHGRIANVLAWRSNQVAERERFLELGTAYRGCWLNGVCP